MPGAWRRSNPMPSAEHSIMRSIRTVLAALVLLPTLVLAQQDSLRIRYANTITQADLRTYLTVLASDAYEGRETGMKGQKMAAQYIMERFEQFGIPPVPDADKRGLIKGYQLPYPLQVSKPGGLSLIVDGTPLGFMQDYFYFSEKLTADYGTDTVVFGGFGKRADGTNDFAGLRCAGGTILVLQDPADAMKPGAVPSAGFVQDLSRKAAAAEAAGARVMLYACSDAHAMMAAYAHYITSPRMKLGGKEKEEAPKRGVQPIIIDKAMAERILARGGWSWKKALKKAKKPGRILHCAFHIHYVPDQQELTGEDVLGYVEGTDKKDELVAVTGHYDHLGMDGNEVYNGADDDGSGTVSVLELAQAFAQAKAEGHGPRRSMLFMTVSGEEKGLLGSEWYSEHPVFPLANTVADLNIDMIGRVDTLHEKNDHYVYVIGSDRLSSELHAINERANDTYCGLDLDYTFNAESDPNRFYFRSDHYNFAKHGIPIIFYFNGVHADYHQPTDEVDKIRFDLLEQRARLVFHTAWELANREERIKVDKAMPKE